MTLEVRRVLALVCAEPSDVAVLRAAHEVMRWFNADELTILEVRSPESPAASLDPDMPLEETSRDRPREEFETMHLVRIGDPVELAALDADAEGIDVVVAAEAGMLTQRLLRKLACTVLAVPPGAGASAGPILAPLDREVRLLSTLEFAAKLALETKQKLELLHVYSVPVGYRKTGQTYEQFAAVMRRHAEEKIGALRRLLEQPGLEISERLVLVKSTQSIAVAILEQAKARPYSQIVLGGRLRRRVAGILFPSISERVVLSSPSPVWVVRDRSDPIGFLEAAAEK